MESNVGNNRNAALVMLFSAMAAAPVTGQAVRPGISAWVRSLLPGDSSFPNDWEEMTTERSLIFSRQNKGTGSTEMPTASPTQAPTDTPTVPPTQAPTDTPTVPPTQAPTDTPTTSPTLMPIKFSTTQELEDAVNEYLARLANADDKVAFQLDEPMGSWDVSAIEDFSNLFNADDNRNASSFNHADVKAWNMSSATTLYEMFEKSAFNQDLTDWDTS